MPGPMWLCQRCGRSFATRNQTHTCASLGNLEDHFAGYAPVVREIFDQVVKVLTEMGPFQILPEKSRIALHARMTFAAFMPRRRWLDGHVVLPERLKSPRFIRIESFSKRNHLHAFRLSQVSDVDEEMIGWLRLAYDVGQQRHHS